MDSPRNSLLSFSELVHRHLKCAAIALGASCACLLSSASAGARDPTPDVSGRRAPVADGIDGLPGIYRVGVPATRAPRVGAGLWLGYGYTESQGDDESTHHRLGSTVAVGGAFLPYFSGAVRLDFRHDVHGEDVSGDKDSGSVLDLTPIIRAGLPISEQMHLGLEGRLVFAGAAAESGLAPPTVDGRFLASYLSRLGLVVSAYGGLRTAQGGNGVDEATSLRPGDRIALGLSEFPAVLMGLGLQQTFGKTSVFLEGSYDLLVGSDAPPAGQSPFRVGLGLRQRLIPGLFLTPLVEVAPGARAPSSVEDPLVPIEPRVSAMLGLSVRFPDVKPKRRPPVVEPEPAVSVEPEPAPPEEPPQVEGHLTVEVVDETGHPISDARVKVTIPAQDGASERHAVVPLAQLNVYEVGSLPLGAAELTVEAELLEGQSRNIRIEENTRLEVELNKASGVGSQLRGLVRAFSGEGLRADILVEPGKHRVKCNDKGEFALDIPPGTYAVTIEADGYVSQKRRLRVGKEGVTVLNADLQRK